VNLDGRKHWRRRIKLGRAAFEQVKRLTRLPPEAKRKVAIGQLIPILTYGSELHQQAPEEGSRLLAEIARWVAMVYRGSSREKFSQLTGIEALEVLTRRKRLRWAAGVYGGYEPELRPRAERILR